MQSFLRHCSLVCMWLKKLKRRSQERDNDRFHKVYFYQDQQVPSGRVVWFGNSSEVVKEEITATERNSCDRAHSAQAHVDNGSFSFQLPMHLCKIGGIEQG